MAFLGLPQWQELRATTDLEAFVPSILGFAKLNFRFPEGTRFPCLPVNEEGSLIFPLAGSCNATAPEIFLARSMGAQLEITDGCVMPMDFSVRPFLALSKRVGELRMHYREKVRREVLVGTFYQDPGQLDLR